MRKHIGIAGAGFAGSVLARALAETGKFKITVFDEKLHVAGNCHTSRDEETGVMVHKFGPHIFATNREDIWEYVNRWGRFESFNNRVIAKTEKGIFSLPINLLTLNQFFGKQMGPNEARDFMGSLTSQTRNESKSYEDKALSFAGEELYKNFFYEFAKKKWGVEPAFLGASEFNSAPVRFNFDDNYSDKKFQGIPVSGYTEIVKRILDHKDIELRLGQRLDPERKRDFDHVFWSGPMDGFFNYKEGKLNYRTLKFERQVETGDIQGNGIIHYCENKDSFTRTIEYKHFTPWEEHEKSVCFKEFSELCQEGDEPCYPMNLKNDQLLLEEYKKLAEQESSVTFIGRLGTYRYLEMDTVISESLELAKKFSSL